MCSHLCSEDQRDVNLYLRHAGLLHMLARAGGAQEEVCQWEEVFPTRLCGVAQGADTPGYREPRARWFLLVVTMVCLWLLI